MQAKSSAVQAAQASLNQKTISAPFDGTLGAFSVTAGKYVSAGQALVKLVNRTWLVASYGLSQDLMPELNTGQQVVITTNAYPKKKFYGSVTFISPTVNKDTGSISLQASVSNKDGLLSPGMYVQIEQQLSVTREALVVPNDAINASVSGYNVYKVDNGKAVQVSVQIGDRYNGNVEVVSGVKVGDVVVVAGQQKLKDGDSVKVVEPESSAAPGTSGASANASVKG